MLNAHNEKRALHGTPALSWSADLAAGAQSWANGGERNGKCNAVHSVAGGAYGENLYIGTNGTSRIALNSWYDEVRHYDWSNPIASYLAGDTDRSKEVRHFTQVVWKASTKLGCGVASCGGFQYFVCRYSPPGNWNATNPGVLNENVPPRR
jgi:uncharacterized protein YkwD